MPRPPRTVSVNRTDGIAAFSERTICTGKVPPSMAVGFWSLVLGAPTVVAEPTARMLTGPPEAIAAPNSANGTSVVTNSSGALQAMAGSPLARDGTGNASNRLIVIPETDQRIYAQPVSVRATAGKLTVWRGTAEPRPFPRYQAASPATASIARTPNTFTTNCIAVLSSVSSPSRAMKPKKMPQQNTGNEFCPISTSGQEYRLCSHDASRGMIRTTTQVSDRIDIRRNGCSPVLSWVIRNRITGIGIEARMRGWLSITQMITTPATSIAAAIVSNGQRTRGMRGGA